MSHLRSHFLIQDHKDIYTCVFFQKFYSFKSSVYVFYPFWVNFYIWCHVEAQFHSFAYTYSVMYMGFPHRSVGKESANNAGDLGSIPGSGRSPGEGNGNPLQYSCQENPTKRSLAGQSMGSQELDMTKHTRHTCLVPWTRVCTQV